MSLHVSEIEYKLSPTVPAQSDWSSFELSKAGNGKKPNLVIKSGFSPSTVPVNHDPIKSIAASPLYNACLA